MACFVCGAECKVFDVVCENGVVKACDNCIKRDNLPVVKKSFDFDVGKRQTVYDRLSRISGVKLGDVRKDEEVKKQDAALRKVVKTYEVSPSKHIGVEGLVDNFHWILMRARRLRKLTQEQLAKEIGEPELMVKNAEQGILPDKYHQLIKKFEIFLGIKLFEEGVGIEEEPEVSFDPVTTRTLTIANLKEMKKKREDEIFEESRKSPPNSRPRSSNSLPSFTKSLAHPKGEDTKSFVNSEESGEENKDGLSKDEMDRIIFGK